MQRGGAEALVIAVAAGGALLALPTRAPAYQATAATSAPDPQGDWIGAPPVAGAEAQLGIHLSRRGGVLGGTLDSPSNGAMNVALSEVTAEGGRLSFRLPEASASFAGTWDPQRAAYVGEWAWSGGTVPLVLMRGRLPPPKAVDWNAPPDPGLVYTPAPAAEARVGPALPVGKCMNMSDMLEAPTEGAWGHAITDEDFRIIKAAGFRTVRIPVSWSTHADTKPPYTIDAAFMRRVHHVVDAATASGLNVILNVHHYHELMSDPDGAAVRIAGLWRQIAASFASAPPSVWFELLNEPEGKLTDANLPAVLGPALAAVRATNPTRPVIIGGQNWSSLDALATLKLPDDPYVVPTFHYYDPFAFTHQGAKWMPHAPPFGRAFGSAADKAALDKAVAKVKTYMARTGRVPLLGEFGAEDDQRLPLSQRIRYYHAVSSAFASVGVASCVWGYRTGFGIRVGDHWLPGMVEAIAAPTQP